VARAGPSRHHHYEFFFEIVQDVRAKIAPSLVSSARSLPIRLLALPLTEILQGGSRRR
jgi:hypothetical protein